MLSGLSPLCNSLDVYHWKRLTVTKVDATESFAVSFLSTWNQDASGQSVVFCPPFTLKTGRHSAQEPQHE